MQYYSEFTALKETAITIGKFDAFHLGHQKLLTRVKEYAALRGMLSVAFSFRPHPSEVLGGGTNRVKSIYSGEEKKELFEDMGLDIYVEYPFTSEFSRMEAEYFAEEIIFKKMRCKYLAVGENYKFGRNQKGTGELLKKIAEKYNAVVDIVDNVLYNNEVVSSTLIRQCILQNEFTKAKTLMFRSYCVNGVVVHGRKLGRTIGIPTLNLIPEESKLLPYDGVYSTCVRIFGVCYKGVTNIGTNPTVSASCKRTIETYLLDFEKMAYGEKITIEFVRKIRDTVRFDGISQLREQIEEDINEVRKEKLYETCSG